MKKNILSVVLFAICAYSFAEESVSLIVPKPASGVSVTTADTLYLQNMNITASASYQATCIKVGSQVTSQQPHGDVCVSGGTLRLTGHEVVLYGGTTVAIGGALEINNQQ